MSDECSDEIPSPEQKPRGRGRPPNRTREKPEESVPRKKKDNDKIGSSSKYTRARSVAKKAQYDVKVLELALSLTKKKNHVLKKREGARIQKPVLKHSLASAVALYLDMDMTKAKWSLLAKDSRSKNAPIFPCYPRVREEMRKSEVTPSFVSEREIRTDMQSMLNISGERLGEAVCLKWSEKSLRRVKFTATVGSDASASHTNPQIKWANKEDEIRDPQLTLVITMMLIVSLDSMTGKDKWSNPTPQSYRLCRPLRFYIGKETTENITAENERLQLEISKLQDHSFTLTNGKRMTLCYEVHRTMYDGKCVNAMTGNKCSSNCPVCRCTQKQAANILHDFTPSSPENLKYGLGLLHVNIRTTENFLHLAYKMPIQDWSIRGDENKGTVEDHKVEVKDDLYSEFNLRVDQILQGKGTTNTGNLARRLFRSPRKFAASLGIDEDLVTKTALAFKLFRCQKLLKLDKVQELCDEIYEDYFRLYSWALMSPTFHKFLKHACQIAATLPKSVAYFAEDALEFWHKIMRKNIRDHTRQNDRIEWITDLWTRAVIQSDPYFSLLSLGRRHKSEDIIITKSMAPYIQDKELEGVEIFEEDDDLPSDDDETSNESETDEEELMDCSG